MGLVGATTKHVFSSAVSGFGLSFGRDIYRKTVKHKWKILAVIIFLVSIGIVFYLGVWIARNQKNFFYSLFSKVISIALLPLFGAIASICLAVISMAPDLFLGGQSQPYVLSLSNNFRELNILVFGFVIDALNFLDLTNIIQFFDEGLKLQSSYFFLTNFLVICIFVLGILRGLSQRSKRNLSWKVEKHNEKFLETNGITEIGDNKYRDSDHQEYRFEKFSGNTIELFPEGTRGKRGYIRFNEQGFFNDWSGMITVGEKKDFLSGNLSKTNNFESNNNNFEDEL